MKTIQNWEQFNEGKKENWEKKIKENNNLIKSVMKTIDNEKLLLFFNNQLDKKDLDYKTIMGPVG